MLIEEILPDPSAALRHMERYFNVGSPSGFTAIYNTSWETHPCGPTETFTLPLARFRPEIVADEGASVPYLESDQLAIHPDMAQTAILTTNAISLHNSDIGVSPTSSSRTVEIVSASREGYFKLNYMGLIGRADRQLTRLHAISGVELSSLLTTACTNKLLPASFTFLREPAARVVTLPCGAAPPYEWGMVYREPRPFPPT